MPTLNQRRRVQETFRSPRSGFTLIELLVVIAIIAILAAISKPTDMIAFGDASFDYSDSTNSLSFGDPALSDAINNPYSAYSTLQPSNNTVFPRYQRRHGGFWNIGFCDGHVESLQARDLFDVSRGSVLKRWNRDNIVHSFGR